jgi:hypothetical protein
MAFPVDQQRRLMTQLAPPVQPNTLQAPPNDNLEALENGIAGRKQQSARYAPAHRRPEQSAHLATA